MQSPVVEERPDPILIWRFRGSPSDGDCDAFRLAHQRLLDAGTPFVTIIDASDAELPTPAQVSRHEAWLAARVEVLRARSLGVALVLPLQPLRWALSCMAAWRTGPGLHMVFPRMDAALLWAEAQLLRFGEG